MPRSATTNIIQQTQDFYYSVYTGDVAGKSTRVAAGNNPSMEQNVIETVWTQGGRLNVLTADTALFVSSTDAGDTGFVFVIGCDENFEGVTRIAQLNGQNQVALGDMMLVEQMAFASPPDGDVYAAESDTLTGGVPDTASKIQIKAIAGSNGGFNAIEAVPAGKTGYLFDLSGTVAKGKDVRPLLSFKIFGQNFFTQAPQFNSFQAAFGQRLVGGTVLPEKTIVLLEAISADPGASITAGFQMVVTDNV